VYPARDQIVVSPALADLIRTDPRARARFPQVIAGTIGPEGLVAPDELRAWVGVDPAALAGARVVAGFGATALRRDQPWQRYLEPERFTVGLLALLLLVPFGILLATCARLSAGAPDRRLATLRLLGAGRREAQLVAAAETGLVTAAGALLGTGAFLLLRPLSGSWHLGRFHWYTGDVHTSPAALAGVVAGLTALSVLVGAFGAAPADPLAVRREAPAPRPRATGLLPPLLGLAMVASVLVQGLPFAAQAWLFAGGVLLCAAGLPAATPVLTAWLGRRLATAPGPVWLRLAGRRLDHTPSHAPRLVASVVVSVFVSGVGLAVAVGYPQWTGTPVATFTVAGPADGLSAAPGVVRLVALRTVSTSDGSALVGTCHDLRQMYAGAESCVDGKAYRLGGFSLGSDDVVVESARIRLEREPLAAAPRDAAAPRPSIFVSLDALPAGPPGVPPTVTVTLSTDPGAAEAFAAHLAGHLPATGLNAPDGSYRGGPLEPAHGFDRSAGLTLVSVMLAVTALLAGAAFAVAAVDRILERRRGNTRLAVLGAPWRVVAAAEFASTAIPLVVGIAVAGAAAALVLTVWAATLSVSTSDLLGAAAPALWAAAALLLILAVLAPVTVRRRVTPADLRRA
jgi:hypothetical protein